MIKINNKIDKEYKAIIYYKDEYVGICENELAFDDVRLQIKNEQSTDYWFVFVKCCNGEIVDKSKRYNFTKDGRMPIDTDISLCWPTYEKILSDLIL